MVVKIKNYLFLISVSFGFVIHAENMDNKVSFRYGFIGKKSTNLDSLFIVEDASTLHTGDQLRLNIEFEKGTFSYIIYQSSQNEFGLLYSSSSQSETEYSDVIYSTLNWRTLDNQAGDETFFLLSSQSRLFALEEHFKDYDQAKSKSKQRIGKKILRELDSFQNEGKDKKSSQLVQRLEKPVIGGVTYRGAVEELLIMEQSLTHSASGSGRTIAVIKINHE